MPQRSPSLFDLIKALSRYPLKTQNAIDASTRQQRAADKGKDQQDDQRAPEIGEQNSDLFIARVHLALIYRANLVRKTDNYHTPRQKRVFHECVAKSPALGGVPFES